MHIPIPGYCWRPCVPWAILASVTRYCGACFGCWCGPRNLSLSQIQAEVNSPLNSYPHLERPPIRSYSAIISIFLGEGNSEGLVLLLAMGVAATCGPVRSLRHGGLPIDYPARIEWKCGAIAALSVGLYATPHPPLLPPTHRRRNRPPPSSLAVLARGQCKWKTLQVELV